MDSLAKKVTSATLVIILLGFMLMVARTNRFSAEDEIAAFPQETEQQPEATIKFNDHGGKSKQALGYELNETADGQEAGNRKLIPLPEAVQKQMEAEVYSFFQGPQAWYAGRTWAGEWSLKDIQGKNFGVFGCGLCCLANIYNTVSPYEVSPWDMLEYSQSVSGYSPSASAAAIGWWDLQKTLTTCGIDTDLYRKPMTYGEFQQHIKNSQGALVLVSSANDNTYWPTTKGHYVTIWLYDEETDTVFLSDPGAYQRNRQRIPLTYVYNALKTASNYQYLLINRYDEGKNTWKADGITETWYRP